MDDETSALPCQREESELFFAELPADLELAKTLCADLPGPGRVPRRGARAAGALGVWGGELFANGVVIARKRPRGRPRKDPVAA